MNRALFGLLCADVVRPFLADALATFVADALAMGSAGGTEEMHSRNIFSQMQRAAQTARVR